MLTVITPATRRRLTTLARVKVELGITGGGDDAYLTTMIDEASAAIASWCRRTFARETIRQVFHVEGQAECLPLARWPRIEIDAISIGDMSYTPDEFEADEAGLLYRLDASGNHRDWSRGRVTIEYSGGYLLPGDEARDLPEDIERAALMLIKADWYARERDPSLRSETVEGLGGSTYFARDSVEGVSGILMPYKITNFG